MKLFGTVIVALLILSVVALGGITTVDACQDSNWNQWNHWNQWNPWNHHESPRHQDPQQKLVFFYCSNGSSNTHLIVDNHTQDKPMLKVVQQLDHQYNITYYDLSLHPGSINMARMAYGVTKTPTLSVLGPDFPKVAGNFHNIVGYESYTQCLYDIHQAQKTL